MERNKNASTDVRRYSGNKIKFAGRDKFWRKQVEIYDHRTGQDLAGYSGKVANKLRLWRM